MLKHCGTKVLETERLILRPFKEGDAGDMFCNWASDDEVTRYLTWPTHKELKITEAIMSTWMDRYKDLDHYHWAICLKETDEVIGSISLACIDANLESCEAGYCIGKAWWNKGLMTEVFQKVIDFGFHEIGFERIAARHDKNNTASGSVMLKCGLQYEGTLRKVLKNNVGVLVDCKYYSILKEEYLVER